MGVVASPKHAPLQALKLLPRGGLYVTGGMALKNLAAMQEVRDDGPGHTPQTRCRKARLKLGEVRAAQFRYI